MGLPTLEIASRMIEKSPGITGLLDRLDSPQTAELIRFLDAVRATTASSVTTDPRHDETQKKRKKETKT